MDTTFEGQEKTQIICDLKANFVKLCNRFEGTYSSIDNENDIKRTKYTHTLERDKFMLKEKRPVADLCNIFEGKNKLPYKQSRTLQRETQNDSTEIIVQNKNGNEKGDESSFQRLVDEIDAVTEDMTVNQEVEQFVENRNNQARLSTPTFGISDVTDTDTQTFAVLKEDTLRSFDSINRIEGHASPDIDDGGSESKTEAIGLVSDEQHFKDEECTYDVHMNILKKVDSDAEDETFRKQEELIRLIPEIKQNDQCTDVEMTSKRKFRHKKRFRTRSSTIDSGILFASLGSEESAENGNKNNLQYMVDVYRPWIKHQINVLDVLNLLSLENDDIDVVKSKAKSCPPDAVDCMLNIMANCEIPGIWQRFIDALERLEYIHLLQLLKNETEVHHSHASAILELVTNDLAQRICFPEFLDKVYEQELITTAEREEADAALETKGSEAAARVIINYVDKHLPNWDVLFADILDQSFMPDIADLFKMIEQRPSQTREGIRSEIASGQRLLQELCLQDVDETTRKQQQTLYSTNENNSTVSNIKIKDFNALCIVVSEIQTNVRKLLNDFDELKHQHRQDV